VQIIYPQTDTGDTKQALYNLFAAYVLTMPPEELIASVERARRDAQLRYVVVYGAACSYCLARAEVRRIVPADVCARIKRTACPDPYCVCHIDSCSSASALNAEEAVEPSLRQIIAVLQQVMCTRRREACDFCAGTKRRP
jgi:hypothetical protein